MGSSASVERDSVGKAKDAESLLAIQKFTELAYDVSPKNETMRGILTNGTARKAFLDFLTSEKKSPGNTFLEAGKSATNENGPMVENLLFDYTLPESETEVSEVSSITENVRLLLSGTREFNNEEIVSILDSSKNESLILLAIEALPRFIASPQFRDWQAAESQRAVTITSNASDVNVTIPEILAADPNLIDTPIVPTEASFVPRSPNAAILGTEDPVPPPSSSSSSIISKSSAKKKRTEVTETQLAVVEAVVVTNQNQSEEDAVENALKNVDYLEIDRILRSGSWLFTFVAAVENLPICITLSTARKDRIGFPLIYVNKYFEATSGYSRTDIMGANCKFLQRDGSGIIRSESDSVERLSNALKNAEPIKVAITNFRRDGTAFKNLLAIKPVFDTKGEYEYVIGVQFDISSQRSSSYALRLVDALVKLLPSTVVY
eukprot:CAMPEP_0182437004 /NCGR_PEP_ID=MMETSP1167-20130531/84738_1 /TAXON_ID=2988 /ORGANISM="Mallomonas Sp, Strain CCMP3275" /LENGTH=434 /DNA_ID=CAMNT_0024629753 /DNA_START=106 /DNA_END=1410 /DNA_ORIENTATION=+